MIIDGPSATDHHELSFAEVDLGYTSRQAIAEAQRCLRCANPSCRKGCPISHEIPQFIAALADGNIGSAKAILDRRSNLPAVCGRVCPHEQQCEGACILNKKQCRIRVGKLERFIADFCAENDLYPTTPPVGSPKGQIAVIGSGPAGLTVAGDLAKDGYTVTVFDAQEEAGGVLMYGIPSFRLNKEVVRREIEAIKRLGVIFRTQTIVGKDVTVEQLLAEGYDAVFIGTGTSLPKNLDLPGKELSGILHATYLLQTAALIQDGQLGPREHCIQPGDRVLVIGGGNVAMDAARTSLRLHAASVTIVYRKTEAELSALRSEVDHAIAEGVQFRWQVSPVQFHGQTHVTALEVSSATDAAAPHELLPADKIILAIGQRPAARIVSTTTGIEVHKDGYLITRERPYGMTTRRGIFAGGDVVHEPATVVLAMKEAKKVAHGIAQYVDAKRLLEEC